MEWIAGDAVGSGGEATVWVARLGSRAMERALAARMAAEVGDDYAATEAAAALSEPPATRGRTALRLGRELPRITQRDFFPPPQREQARRAVAALSSSIEVTG